MLHAVAKLGLAMTELSAPDYQFARFVIERGLGLIYLVAFVVAASQFPPLLGERGLAAGAAVPAASPVPASAQPVPPRATRTGCSRSSRGPARSSPPPSSLGLPQRAPLPVTMLAWFVLWALYQSIVNVGQARSTASAGRRCCSRRASSRSSWATTEIAPPWPVILLFRWLAFRVEFGAGLIKLRGDPCWRELRCME